MKEQTQILRLTREEVEIIKECCLYYRDEATQNPTEESSGVGLDRDSKGFKLICNVMKEINERLLFWNHKAKRKNANLVKGEKNE